MHFKYWKKIMANRDLEVLHIIMTIFVDMNHSPGQTCPLKTIWFSAMKKYSLTNAAEFNAAIRDAINNELLVYSPKGPIGGVVALTEKGYNKSRNRN